MPFEPKRPEGPYIVKGLPFGDDGRPAIRQELRTLSQSLVSEQDRVPQKTDQWHLYLLGLSEFQRLSPDKQLSYFQVAGIHGQPYEAWPKDDKTLIGMQKQRTGFCTHTSILFLSWHRPYLALFEALVREAMQYVADEFSKEGKNQYQAAVKDFRLPYWDWADMNLPVFPEEVMDATVRVPMPRSLVKEHHLTERDGLVDLSNPLFSFRFPDNTPDKFRIGNLESTVRYFVNLDVPGTHPLTLEERNKLIYEKIKAYTRENPDFRPERNLAERLMFLLQSYERYDQVSNNRVVQNDPVRPGTGSGAGADNVRKGQGYGSLEDVHNMLHLYIGGRDGEKYTGHMAQVPLSAFDPIFWLHHTNIDRLVSIWQGLHDTKPLREEAWVTTRKTVGGTFITPAGSEEGIKTPLAPFYKPRDGDGDHAFWTSADVRSTDVFGYAYPETQYWNFSTLEKYQDDIRRRLRAEISTGSLANMIAGRKAGDAKPEVELRRRAERLAQVQAVKEPANALTLMSIEAAMTERSGSVAEGPGADFISALPPINVPNVELPTRSIISLAKPDELDRSGDGDDGEGSNDTYLEWLVNIKAEKHTLEGAYVVHVFLGPVEESEPTKYRLSPYHVGTFAPLGQSEETSCGKCKVDQQDHVAISGQIPLTVALAERFLAGLIDNLEEQQVVGYLQRNLHWEVVDGHGQRLEGQRNRVEGLVVSVASNKVTIGREPGEPPRYSDLVTLYPEITTKADPSLGGRAEGTGLTDSSMYA